LEKGLPVREATINAMNEITGPILAITLVLSSVLLPSAFLGSITAEFFRQFALTISASMIISAVNAMTMTPARAASIFGSRKAGEQGDEGKEALPWWFFGLLGGLASVWLLAPTLGPRLGLTAVAEGEAAVGGLKGTLQSWGVYVVLFVPGIEIRQAVDQVLGVHRGDRREAHGAAHVLRLGFRRRDDARDILLDAFDSVQRTPAEGRELPTSFAPFEESGAE